MLKNDVAGYAVLLGASAIFLPEAVGSLAVICVGMYGAETIFRQ